MLIVFSLSLRQDIAMPLSVGSRSRRCTISAWQARQRFSVSYRAHTNGFALQLCCGTLAARSAPALVPCAPSFLRGLSEGVDPLTLRRPLACSRLCGKRCNGFQFHTEHKSQYTCLSVHYEIEAFIINVLYLYRSDPTNILNECADSNSKFMRGRHDSIET